MTKFSYLLAALALAGGYSLSHAQASAQGGVLVGANGMTLYTFDKDMAGSGKSACNGTCATNWPPLAATVAPGGEGYSLIWRDDGTQQAAYKGKPLYYWSQDGKAGDKGGDGKFNLWHAAMP